MSNSTSSKSLSKKLISNRDRDKNKSLASESGGSSQCDTPPLIEKDASTSDRSSHGKYAGIRLESLQCMAEQVGVEINTDAATNLAEDVSYKLRQIIHNIALHSSMMKKSRVDAADVNTTLMLSDTSPVVGATAPQYVSFGDEDLCCELETTQNITECAMTTQSYVFASLPTFSVEWITDDKNLSPNSNISAPLQNYYMKVAKAILSLRRKVKEVAIRDLNTNTRIGPIFPNLFNLAVLVLNDENLKALNVPAKKPLQSNVLDMMDALCSNPCSYDTNIQQQFQRLFPMMVSNILSNGTLSEKMVTVLTKITRTWPSLSAMGKDILSEYLSKAPLDALTAPLLACLHALGRAALTHACGARALAAASTDRLRLDAATCLLRPDADTYLEDHVQTDYTLYEMLGDSILPRRTLFPVKVPQQQLDSTSAEKPADDDFYIPTRILTQRSKLRIIPRRPSNTTLPRDSVFEPVRFKSDRILSRIQIKVKSFRTVQVKRDRISVAYAQRSLYNSSRSYSGCIVASGALNRFRYRLNNDCKPFPIFGTYML